MPIHAKAFTGCAKGRQKHNRKGVHQKKPITSLRLGHANLSETHAKPQIFYVSKMRFDIPSKEPLINYL